MALDALVTLNFFGFELGGLVTPALVFALVYAGLWAATHIIIARVRRISEHTKTKLDDALFKGIDHINWPFYFFISLFASAQFLDLPRFAVDTLWVATIAVAIFYAIKVLQEILRAATDEYIERQTADRKRDPTIIRFASKVVSYLMWLLGGLLLLDNIPGVDILTLLAGLGVAGIAVALAVQNILSDIFSSLSIYFDKPFKVGDFIILGEDMGTVEKIGIKTTRVRALQGEEIVFSNNELTSARIHNYGKMQQRRIVFKFGVVYETPPEKLKKVLGIVNQSVAKVKGSRLDRVHFREFGDFSLNYEAVYFIPTGDYNAYMDAQQTINLSLVELFKKNKIEFAYPTQKIFVAK